MENPKEREKRKKDWYAELKKDKKWMERENNRKRDAKQRLKELKARGIITGKESTATFGKTSSKGDNFYADEQDFGMFDQVKIAKKDKVEQKKKRPLAEAKNADEALELYFADKFNMF